MSLKPHHSPERDAAHLPFPHSWDWRDALIERHPALFKRLSERPDVGDGWALVLVNAVKRIGAAAELGEDVHIVEIKEECGTLLIRTDAIRTGAVKAAVAEAVALAEAASECTCDICGSEGVLYEWRDILATRCAGHAAGAPVPVRPGWENIRIVQHAKNGKVRIVSCRRYDRAKDCFIDVSPLALGIKE